MFGEANGTRLQTSGSRLELALNRREKIELLFRLTVTDLTLVIAAESVDGFLRELFGDEELKVSMPLALAWSSLTGVNFGGGVGLTASRSPHLEIGPVVIERFDATVTSTVDSSAPPDLRVEFTLCLSGELGPVGFSAEGIGLHLALVFEKGNAGPLDIAAGFAPPKGLGISVDSPVVFGGGFLAFDSERGQYAGVVELKLEGGIAVKGLGLIATRLPNNVKGFSLVLIIFVEGFTPIQLGFGFRLTGIGGLLAINRTFAKRHCAPASRTTRWTA